MRAPEFWLKDGLRARLLDPVGRLYGLATDLRRRWTRPEAAPVPVICVGNLSVGGTGKTPTALALAERLIARGHRPHFLSRGYGGRAHGPLRVDPSQHDCALIGDEALLLAEVAPTWVARDRLAGARAAASAGAELVIMDDGLQNLRIRPDVALVVVDGEVGFSNHRLLPAGPLRESVAGGLRRASAVIRIGADRSGVARQLPASLPLIEAELRPGCGATALAGRKVLAFAGIGRPAKFFATLAATGAAVIETVAFADHHRYRRAEIEDLLGRAERLGAVCVTTAKDAVRLPAGHREHVLTLPVRLHWRQPEAADRLLDRALGSRCITLC